MLSSLVLIGGMSYLSDDHYTKKASRNIAIVVLLFALYYAFKMNDWLAALALMALSALTFYVRKVPLSSLNAKHSFAALLLVLVAIVWHFEVFRGVIFDKNVYINRPFRLYFSGYTQWALFSIASIFISLKIYKSSTASTIQTSTRILSILLIFFWTTFFGVKLLDRKNITRYNAFDSITANIYYGVGPNAYNKYGATRLHAAIDDGDLEKVKELIAEGVNINKQGGNLVPAKLPLSRAIIRDQYEIFMFMLKNGAQINILDEDGLGPLHIASKDIRYIKPLLEHGADLSFRDRFGRQLIHRLAETSYSVKEKEFLDNSEAIEFVAQAGAEINSQGQWGTPLHHAVFGANVEGAIKLLELGADASIVNKEGKTPREMAISLNNSKYSTGLELGKKKNVRREEILQYLN